MKHVYKFFGLGNTGYPRRYKYIDNPHTDSLWYLLIESPIEHVCYTAGTIGAILIILQIAGVVDVSMGMCMLIIMSANIWRFITSLIVGAVRCTYDKEEAERLKSMYSQYKEKGEYSKYEEDIDEEPDNLA